MTEGSMGQKTSWSSENKTSTSFFKLSRVT